MRKNNIPTPLCLGLIGFPLGHSLSPTLHAAALAQYKIKGDYRLYPVSPMPEGLPELKALLERLRQGELHGLNVTIPHKQAILEWVDELTPSARAIGAVNTLINRDGRLVGDNTDAPGFWADIESLWGFDHPARALVLGSGGVARAMVYTLAAHGWQVTIAAARPEDMQQAHTLAKDLSPVGGRLDVIQLDPAVLGQYGNAALVVNTTPLGMSPHPNVSPWPEEMPLPLACKVYDAVYNPLETRFVSLARAAGRPAETGLGMLIAQAALSFECWTGLPAPFEVMRRSVG